MMPWLAAIHDNLEALHEHDDNPNVYALHGERKYPIQIIKLYSWSIFRTPSFCWMNPKSDPSAAQNHNHTVWQGFENCLFGNLAQIDSDYLTFDVWTYAVEV